MKRILPLLTLCASLSVAYSQTLVTGPSTTIPPYLTSHLTGVTIKSILTVGDGTTVPKTTGGGTTRMVGIPDGLGAFDNGDGTLTVLMNHEIQSTSGIARAHGAAGAFVSKWIINKTTHAVVSGSDQIQSFHTWNGSSYVPAAAIAFDRMCSADLPAPTALYNSATSKGTQQRIYMNGEETSGGRALAHMVSGADAGKTYHMPHLGFANFENVLLCPVEQDKTIAILTDDTTNGEVLIYVGTKNSTGTTDVEKAGLTSGALYALKINGKPFEMSTTAGAAVTASEIFSLGQVGGPGYLPDGSYPANSSEMGTRLSAVSALQMGGPEDGAWDTRPGHTNKFYFHTKGSSSNGIESPTRLWQMAFTDITQPELGGTLTILLDAPDTLSGSLDNMCITNNGKLLLQEDLGSDLRLGRIYEYDLATAKLEEVAAFQGSRFYLGGASFMTIDEETSGVISLEDILGAGWFASTIQVHTNAHIASGDRTELVEGGQLVFFNLSGRSSDFVREKPVAMGSTWKYMTNGTDPGHTGTTWYSTAYDDSTWSSGATPIGYGDDGETATDLTQPATPRPAAYYFRRTFTLANPADVSYLEVYMQRDDGAVVYINGVEVGRSNVSPSPALANTTFAASTTGNEPNWVYIPVKVEGLSLTGTNTIAVSVHQDSATSSDIRMNCEVIAFSKPSAGAAAATPTGLASGTTTESSIPLTWTAQTDAKQFQLERKRSGDNAWEVLRYDLPGTFTSFTDTLLSAATQYSYRLMALNVFGQSAYTAVVNATTATPSAAPIIFQEDFESLTGTVSSPPASTKQATFSTVSGITTVNVAGTFNWYPAGPFGSQATGGLGKIVQGNNFGGVGAGDDWLILPPVNTAFYNGETFDFKSDARFNDTGLAGLPNTGPPSNSVGLDVLISTNYRPAVHTNPSSATWTLLPGYALDTDFAIFGNGVASGSINLAGIAGVDSGPAYIAFRYRASGTTSNLARAWEIDQLFLRGNSGLNLETTLAPLTAVNVASTLGWAIANAGARNAALGNNFGADVGGEDWLITPRMVTTDVSAAISFDYWQRFSDSGQSEPLSIMVSTNYDPATHTNPNSATWTNLTGTNLNGVTDQTWTPLSPITLGVVSTNVYVAFRYRSSGTGSGTTKQIGVDNLKFYPSTAGGPPVSSFAETKNGGLVNFNGTVTGGTAPFTYLWNFGDGTTSTLEDPAKIYTTAGTYTVTFTVTDSLSLTHTTTKTNHLTFTNFVVPSKAPANVRVQSYNAGLNSEAIGTNTYDANAVANALAAGTHISIRRLAEVIQRTNPDIILLNEFDVAYTGQNYDAAGTLTRLNNLRNNFLAVPQATGLSGVSYPYHYIGGTNTGIHSGYDLKNDGVVNGTHTNTTATSQAYGDDAFGFGQYPGKYGFVLLSKYPINTAAARTFQYFLWKDMPGALLPKIAGSSTDYYNTDERNVFRLSSKSHWDVPVIVAGHTVHILCSHPTPPVFDDGETSSHPLVTGTNPNFTDWNGLRNYDEIRFWVDYVDPTKSSYIYDDAHLNINGTAAAGNPLYTGTPTGGLPANARFVILGDENSDPDDGDSTFDSIQPLVDSIYVDSTVAPTSTGALADVPVSFMNRAFKTSDFNLRADYCLPSKFGFGTAPQAGCYWPISTDLTYYLLSASDHRTVWIDLPITADGQPPAPIGYDLWWQSYQYFAVGSPNSGSGLDIDKDGITNLAEFLFGTNPNATSTPPTLIEPGTTGAEFVYRRNRGAAATWTVQTSTNLTNWPDAVHGVDYEIVSTTLDPQDSNVDYVRVRLLNPVGAGGVFVRAQAVPTP